MLAIWLSGPGSEGHGFALVEIVVFIIHLSILILNASSDFILRISCLVESERDGLVVRLCGHVIGE